MGLGPTRSPMIEWARGYDRTTLSSDLTAAIIVTVMLIPQSLAYAAEDSEQAFSYASPDIRALFQTPENFLAMVKESSQVVYRPLANSDPLERVRRHSQGGIGSLSAHRPTLLVFADASASINTLAIGLELFFTNCR